MGTFTIAVTEHRLNTRAAGTVAAAVLCSRILGLLRELIFAAFFGAGRNMDAFITAFRAPNLLRDLFAEGALSTAFVTVFSKKIAVEGDSSAWKLASKVAALTTVFMSLITLLGILGASLLIGILAPGFSVEKAQLTILLCRIMFPFILLVSLAALVMGMLNAKGIFGAPAMASSFFNLGSIVGGVFFGWWLDPSFREKALIGLALGTLLGGLLQLIVQLPSLRKVGFFFRPDFHWRDAGVRAVLVLMVPAVIAGSAVQVNVMINSIFASWLGDGPISWLSYAFRLMQLPLGVFGVAVATVTLPIISKLAANGEAVCFRETLAKAMRLAVFLTIPSAVGLILLASPIIGLIYQRGKFDLADTAHTAEALRFYALGLVGYSCVKVLSPAFYALDRKWTPMLISFLSIGLNLLLNWLLIFYFGLGYRGLALSTALSACFNFGMLYFIMRRHMKGLETMRFISTAMRSFVSALAMAAVCWGLLHMASAWLYSSHLLLQAVSLLSVIGIAILCYLGMCWLLGVEETRSALNIFPHKIFPKFGKRGMDV